MLTYATCTADFKRARRPDTGALLSKNCQKTYFTPAGVHGGTICDKLAKYCKFWLLMLKDLTKHSDRTVHVPQTSSIEKLRRNNVIASMATACDAHR